ncbi:Bypass of stop codon protein 6 like [Verticillium longisporum]|uniref:Bypass of stop codon protein 6 like n=1 Tax=Verticillium longisporum TaxID=100787 RepID=A0A8I2Z5G7_VERLO|nr:Bypass of stop codon protein 6 like [Verticillium longisporum]
MDSSLFKSLVEVESREASAAAASPSDGFPPPPQKAVQRTYPGAPYRGDESIELQRLHTEHGVSHPSSRPGTPPSSPPGGSDLEMSRPGSPSQGATDVAEPLQSMWDPYMNRWRLLTACLMNLGNGLNDSAPGALIPYMEKHYNIGYAVVSLIFVGNALGFIFAAVFLDALRSRMSRAHLLVFGQAILLAAYIPLIVGAPFPAIIVGFFFLGFAMSINLAMNNIFCGSLQNATTALGAMHGSYGIGGTVGPIIATAIATSGNPWYRFYLLPLSLAFGNLFFGWWSFAKFERDQPLTLQPTLSAAALAANSQFLSMFYALRMRLVLLGALFIFAYQGAEVSISGWVISFLIATRDVGDPGAVGYVTAGFWAGITLGRFLLSAPAHRIGEKRFVYIVTAGAACFQLLVWQVPNLVGAATSLAIVGLLLGPIYPCAAAVFMRGMSGKHRASGMVVISAFGSSGGAVAPFTTGLLAQAFGTWVLHPIALGLFVCMTACWFWLPTQRKRNE